MSSARCQHLHVTKSTEAFWSLLCVQVHAAVSVAGVAAAIAAVTAATAASALEDSTSKTSMAVASAAALVAAQCVEVAESMGADRDHMASVVSSAVNVRSAGDIMTLTAAAATCKILHLKFHC